MSNSRWAESYIELQLPESVNEASAELGYNGLLALARSLPVQEPTQVGPALLAALARFRGASQPFDDLNVIVLQECDVFVLTERMKVKSGCLIHRSESWRQGSTLAVVSG